MAIPKFLLILISLCVCSIASAISEADSLFEKALNNFDAKNYEIALESIQHAVEIDPNKSTYYNLLGKCYGRLAEKSNFIKAISLAKKTLIAFEKAVELDDDNVNALKNLMEYYRSAPGFLGGSNKKADEIEKILQGTKSPS